MFEPANDVGGGDYSAPASGIRSARLVVVDDDSLVTSSLRSFLQLELELEPTIFNDSAAALEHLREHDVDMVISDFLMPVMDGISLLAEARRLHPEAPRVLLTGYADKQNAIRAINDAQIFHYLEKPWENEQLRHIVINGVERSFLVRQLFSTLSKLAETEEELERFRRSLVRAFA